jgi:starch phosphorylase
MLWEYAESYYVPAARGAERMRRDGFRNACEIAAWQDKIRLGWPEVRVEAVAEARTGPHRVGEGFGLTATVRLGEVSPEDVTVEAYYGPLDATREVRRGRAVALRLEQPLDSGIHRYSGTIPSERSGMQGYSVRVRPSHPHACDFLGGGFVAWWQG